MHNLNRIKRAGIPCPEVVCLKKHILVMSFIGSNGKCAPTLKEAILTMDQLEQAYKETVAVITMTMIDTITMINYFDTLDHEKDVHKV